MKYKEEGKEARKGEINKSVGCGESGKEREEKKIEQSENERRKNKRKLET